MDILVKPRVIGAQAQQANSLLEALTFHGLDHVLGQLGQALHVQLRHVGVDPAWVSWPLAAVAVAVLAKHPQHTR